MNQCLRITFLLKDAEGFLPNNVRSEAQTLGIEGIAQAVEQGKIKIIACGPKDSIEQFVDFLHAQAAKTNLEDIQVEPILKERDYRGVFRVIE